MHIKPRILLDIKARVLLGIKPRVLFEPLARHRFQGKKGEHWSRPPIHRHIGKDLMDMTGLILTKTGGPEGRLLKVVAAESYLISMV